jgi:hypothetical protein
MASWEFGASLRHWRDGVAPVKVEVAQGRRRRADGLHREEFAELAGNSLRFASFLAAAAATAWAAMVSAPVPVASAAPCPDVEVVFARATAEPPGVGGLGQAFVDALTSDVGGKVGGGLSGQLRCQ